MQDVNLIISKNGEIDITDDKNAEVDSIRNRIYLILFTEAPESSDIQPDPYLRDSWLGYSENERVIRGNRLIKQLVSVKMPDLNVKEIATEISNLLKSYMSEYQFSVIAEKTKGKLEIFISVLKNYKEVSKYKAGYVF